MQNASIETIKPLMKKNIYQEAVKPKKKPLSKLIPNLAMRRRKGY